MTSILTIIRQRRHRRDQTRSSAQQRTQRTVFGVGFTLSVALVALVITAALASASVTSGLPPAEQPPVLLDPDDGQLLQPTRFYDRTGQHLIGSLSPAGSPRTYIPYAQFPHALVDAPLALTRRLVKALLRWAQPDSPLRAIHERMLAAQVTARYGRQQVLEWYLNSANYGRYAYGAEAAAQLYF